MTPDQYAQHDATALAELVRRGDAGSAELATLALQAAERMQPRLGAVVERYHDVPDRLARQPSEGPLAGVPMLIKDAGVAERGRRQERGSRLLEGHVAAGTSYLVRRFRRAGLVSVGRSAAPEFSLAGCTVSPLHGATRNPWDPTCSAGGSSGGAAAAVAAGIVPVAHATDAAGSIRWPASACGCVGLKPSRGRVSHGPEAGEPLLGMDTQFVIARSVRDVALLLDVAAGPEPGDPVPLPLPSRRFSGRDGAVGRRLCVAVASEAWGGHGIDGEVRRALDTTASTLGDLGHRVEVDLPPLPYDEFVDAAVTSWALGFDQELDALGRELGRRVLDHVEGVTASLYLRGRAVRGADVARAEATANRIRRGFGAFFQRYDVLVTPTLLRAPEPLGTYASGAADEFESYFRHCDRTGVFLPPFNMTGQPALSLPLGWSDAGLPIGIQLVAAFAAEATLLALAAELERALPWAHRRPRLHVAGHHPPEVRRS